MAQPSKIEAALSEMSSSITPAPQQSLVFPRCTSQVVSHPIWLMMAIRSASSLTTCVGWSMPRSRLLTTQFSKMIICVEVAASMRKHRMSKGRRLRKHSCLANLASKHLIHRPLIARAVWRPRLYQVPVLERATEGPGKRSLRELHVVSDWLGVAHAEHDAAHCWVAHREGECGLGQRHAVSLADVGKDIRFTNQLRVRGLVGLRRIGAWKIIRQQPRVEHARAHDNATSRRLEYRGGTSRFHQGLAAGEHREIDVCPG